MQLNKLFRHKDSSKTSGFTIIELLVVIVVIGILAAIVIVAYTGVRTKAATAVLESDLTQSRTKLALYKVSHDNQYPPTEQAAKDYLILASNTVLEYTASTDFTSYCMTASSDEAKTSRYVDSATEAIIDGTCDGHHGYVASGQAPAAPVWSMVSAGDTHTCGIANGKAYCWGANGYGRLGNNSTTNSSVPVAVDTSGVLAGKTVTDISAGFTHTCAVADGKAYCWGQNGPGRLGNNSTVNSSVPVAVDTSGVLAGKTVTSVSVGYYHTCAVASGRAYCWGASSTGQLGDGTSGSAITPTAVTTSGVLSGKTVTAISSGYNNTCAVAGGQAFCWGSNINKELGNNATANSLVPVAVYASGVLAGKTITTLSTGDYHTCGVAAGKAYCWGPNFNGQLGNSSTDSTLVPVAVYTAGMLSGKTITSISNGTSHSCVVTDGANAYCWGSNGFAQYGQLGNNSVNDSAVPVAVNTAGALSGKTITAISAGGYHTCAIASDQVYCWGLGTSGELGNNATTNSLVAVPVTPLP